MTVTRRLLALETAALAEAVARFRAWIAAADPDDARFWDELERAGFAGRNPAAIEAWEASRSAEERARFAAVDAAFGALLDPAAAPARLRAALAAAAPHLGLDGATPPHRVVVALTGPQGD